MLLVTIFFNLFILANNAKAGRKSSAQPVYSIYSLENFFVAIGTNSQTYTWNLLDTGQDL